MKKRFLFFLLLLISFTSQAQSLKKVKVHCTDDFNINASVTVEDIPNDRLLVIDAMKNSLVTAGFKVISERMAKEKIELSNKGQVTDTTFNQDVSLGKTKYIKSVYVVTLNYTWNAYDALTNLQGQIVDLASDGVIVATFSFHQSGGVPVRKPDAIMEKIVEGLKNKIK